MDGLSDADSDSSIPVRSIMDMFSFFPQGNFRRDEKYIVHAYRCDESLFPFRMVCGVVEEESFIIDLN